jgi:hypothetical protein
MAARHRCIAHTQPAIARSTEVRPIAPARVPGSVPARETARLRRRHQRRLRLVGSRRWPARGAARWLHDPLRMIGAIIGAYRVVHLLGAGRDGRTLLSAWAAPASASIDQAGTRGVSWGREVDSIVDAGAEGGVGPWNRRNKSIGTHWSLHRVPIVIVDLDPLSRARTRWSHDRNRGDRLPGMAMLFSARRTPGERGVPRCVLWGAGEGDRGAGREVRRSVLTTLGRAAWT